MYDIFSMLVSGFSFGVYFVTKYAYIYTSKAVNLWLPSTTTFFRIMSGEAPPHDKLLMDDMSITCFMVMENIWLLLSNYLIPNEHFQVVIFPKQKQRCKT